RHGPDICRTASPAARERRGVARCRDGGAECAPQAGKRTHTAGERTMSDTNQTTAPVALTPRASAPLPAEELQTYDAAPPEYRAEIDRALTEMDITDSRAILLFGSRAQEE